MSVRLTDEELHVKVQSLPKWARDYVTRLERQVQDAQHVAEEARLATNPDDTNTVLYPYQDTIGLPVSARVRFILASNRATSDDRRHDRWIDVHVRKDGSGIELMGSSGLQLQCGASNVMYVDVKDRW